MASLVLEISLEAPFQLPPDLAWHHKPLRLVQPDTRNAMRPIS